MRCDERGGTTSRDATRRLRMVRSVSLVKVKPLPPALYEARFARARRIETDEEMLSGRFCAIWREIFDNIETRRIAPGV